MIRLYSYNPKEAKYRQFAYGLLTQLQKNKIKPQIDRDRGIAILSINETDQNLAQSIYNIYSEKIRLERIAFAKAIKINYPNKFFQIYKVSFLYNKLRKTSIGPNIYLPDHWKNGKSIQTSDQKDFYSFANVQISHSKSMDGDRLIVKTLSHKKVWILNNNFMENINAFFDDCKLQHHYITTMDELLDGMCIASFSGLDWKQFIDTKKIFEI